jgi:hypothetical protein
VGFSEEVLICRTPAYPSKNYGLVFKSAFPKPIPLPLLALLYTLRVHYTHHTRTIPSASVWHVIRSVRDLCALRKCQLLRAAAGDGELNQGVAALVSAYTSMTGNSHEPYVVFTRQRCRLSPSPWVELWCLRITPCLPGRRSAWGRFPKNSHLCCHCRHRRHDPHGQTLFRWVPQHRSVVPPECAGARDRRATGRTRRLYHRRGSSRARRRGSPSAQGRHGAHLPRSKPATAALLRPSRWKGRRCQ